MGQGILNPVSGSSRDCTTLQTSQVSHVQPKRPNKAPGMYNLPMPLLKCAVKNPCGYVGCSWGTSKMGSSRKRGILVLFDCGSATGNPQASSHFSKRLPSSTLQACRFPEETVLKNHKRHCFTRNHRWRVFYHFLPAVTGSNARIPAPKASAIGAKVAQVERNHDS